MKNSNASSQLITNMIGNTLSHYKIISKLGQGGMGEVYLAEDSRLDRKVAIKVLPERLSERADLRERFEREARAVSSLNHPHICTLHDIGEQDGIHFLVMEHLEGETLASRLEKGALSLEQTLEYAIQIADALDKAHRQGVVHRDLKPGNIMLVKSGAKLLDFGLAKLKATEATEENLSALPTEQANLTAEGTILGTLQYMAPEQLEAKDTDSRTDIFAFGAVVYEMATGKKAFEGSSQASLIAAIMGQEPRPMSELQPMTPPTLDHVVRRCMAKEPDGRWQAASDVMVELKWVTEVGSQVALPSSVTVQPLWKRAIPATLLVVAIAAFSGLVVWRVATPDPEVYTTLFIVPVEGGHEMGSGKDPRLAVSPDGRTLAYVAQDQLFVRSLDRLEALALEGTQGAEGPFFSPDGQEIGFTQNNALRRTSVEGGPVTEVRGTNTGTVAEASWGDDGHIVYRPRGSRVLWRVPADGGTPQRLTTLRDGEPFHTWPQVLDGGNRILYTALRPSGVWIGAAVILEDLETGERTTVAEEATYGRYVHPGHILYATATGTIMAVPYDIEGREVTDGRVPVASDVRVAGWGGAASFAVSDGGTLAIVEGSNEIRTQFWWIDRQGQHLGRLGEPLGSLYFDLSPDGRQLAAGVTRPANGDIFLIDSTSGDARQFTFGEAFDFSPVWSPTSDRVAYVSEDVRSTIEVEKVSERGGSESLYTGQEDSDLWVRSWSPDGQWLLFVEAPEGQGDIYALNVEDGKTIPIVVTPAAEDNPQFSPDGRWIAYQTDNAGRAEVYVVAFPEVGRPEPISAQGGDHPRWAPTGDELFFWNNRTLMSSKVVLSETFSREPAKRLFDMPELQQAGNRYVVAQESNKFIVSLKNPDWPASEIIVIENWTEELKRLAPNDN